MAQTRQEKDSLGIVEVPADAMYGAQTARAVENFPISGMRASKFLIRAIGMVKQAAAEANGELNALGDLNSARAQGIAAAAAEVVVGKMGRRVCRRRLPGRRRRQLPHERQ